MQGGTPKRTAFSTGLIGHEIADNRRGDTNGDLDTHVIPAI